MLNSPGNRSHYNPFAVKAKILFPVLYGNTRNSTLFSGVVKAFSRFDSSIIEEKDLVTHSCEMVIMGCY